MANKVEFGLKNVYYAPFTVAGNVITYETPIRIPGAVSLSLTPRGDQVEFYADDHLYYNTENNQGYDGTASFATLPESFAKDCLGETLVATDKVLGENSISKGKSFALLFEFDGDVKATRYVLYNCTASRPTITGNTKTAQAEPQAGELTFTASPRPTDYQIKYKTTSETPAPIYDAWYTAVYEPTV